MIFYSKRNMIKSKVWDFNCLISNRKQKIETEIKIRKNFMFNGFLAARHKAWRFFLGFQISVNRIFFEAISKTFQQKKRDKFIVLKYFYHVLFSVGPFSFPRRLLNSFFFCKGLIRGNLFPSHNGEKFTLVNKFKKKLLALGPEL